VTRDPVGVVDDSSVERFRLFVWFRHIVAISLETKTFRKIRLLKFCQVCTVNVLISVANPMSIGALSCKAHFFNEIFGLLRRILCRKSFRTESWTTGPLFFFDKKIHNESFLLYLRIGSEWS
jgi:hypothetical protein